MDGEEVLIVDVDNNCFLQKPSFVDDYRLLPDQFWTPVLKAIKDSVKEIKSKAIIQPVHVVTQTHGTVD